MAGPASTDEFVDLVRRSGVVDEDRLVSYMDQLRLASAELPEPTRLAGQLVSDGLLTLFQAEQILQGRFKRFTIGKYRVLERLGSGSMGQVFLCEHKLMRRRVAIKVLPNNKADDPVALERFYREARAVAALDHPNLARAFDIDQDHAVHFLVMEYVDGASLQDIVKRSGPYEPLRACHYIYQAALGLEYAFKVAGLVHRDIKPGNILVDRSGMVKVLDMGLARFFNGQDDALTLTQESSILGTADYVAPEQAIDSHAADIRSDIYSLGATFYCILAGAPPFPDGSVAQKLMSHQMREPKPLRELRPEIPEEVAAIVKKMMAKAPKDRYQTPAEIAEALEPWIQSPILPPAEEEMPDWCLAAQGANPPPAAAASIASARASTGYSPPKARNMAATSSGLLSTPTRGSGLIAMAAIALKDSPRSNGPKSDNPFAAMRPGSSARNVSPDERAVLESVYISGSGSQRYEPTPARGMYQPKSIMPMVVGAAAFFIGIGAFLLLQHYLR